MKRYFDFRRFGNYIKYDLVNSWKRYGISALITGLFPLVIFIFFKFFNLVFGQSPQPLSDTLKVTSLICVVSILIVAVPSKIYGFVTEKKAGANWLMIPASALEKCLWMCILLCVVVPVSVGLVFMASDVLLSVVFPHAYGGSLTLDGMSGLHSLVSEISDFEFADVTLAGYITPFLNFCIPVLVFTLGALVFKTGKPAKTILAVIVFMSVLTSLMFTVFQNVDLEGFFDEMTVKRGQFLINLVGNVSYLVIYSLLLGGIYYRIKTLKH